MPEIDLTLWLKPEDIGKEAQLIFRDAGEYKEIQKPNTQESKKVFEITVSLVSGEERLWTMNEKSQRAVAQVYGTNTDRWITKPVQVFVVDQDVFGTMKKVIYARVPVPTIEEVTQKPII